MKDLQYYFEMAKDELDVLDIPYGNIKECTVNTRAKGRYGQCKVRNGVYTINISSRILEDYVPTKSLMTVLCHEILHSVKGCMNHGEKWKSYAELVNDCYGYNITTTSSDEKYGLKPMDKDKEYKYTIECTCGKKYYKHRKTYWMKDMEYYGCYCPICGSRNLKLIQNF